MDSLIADKMPELEQICATRGWTVGLAESCTGGLLSAWMCERPGTSKFFAGGVVTYARPFYFPNLI